MALLQCINWGNLSNMYNKILFIIYKMLLKIIMKKINISV